MMCAQQECEHRADIAVSFGNGLIVLLCYRHGVRLLVEAVGRLVVEDVRVLDPRRTGSKHPA